MRLCPILPVMLLAACTAPDGRNRDRENLAAELAGRTAGPAQACVSSEASVSLRPVDNMTVTVERGDTVYVNRLAGPCPGLSPADTLIVEMHGSEYCRGDHIRSLPPGGGAIPGPICILGDFVPYRRPR
ncbi:MAG: hypothetical protein QOH81_2465 [Sphingomonadales bacterium]|nr:hypothetical protein [Sphingomonadales bacterium]